MNVFKSTRTEQGKSIRRLLTIAELCRFFQISQRYLKQLQAQQSKQDDQVNCLLHGTLSTQGSKPAYLRLTPPAAGQIQDAAPAETATQAELGEATDRLQRQQNLELSTSGSEDVSQPSILCARCYSLRHYGYVNTCTPLSAVMQVYAIA